MKLITIFKIVGTLILISLASGCLSGVFNHDTEKNYCGDDTTQITNINIDPNPVITDDSLLVTVIVNFDSHANSASFYWEPDTSQHNGSIQTNTNSYKFKAPSNPDVYVGLVKVSYFINVTGLHCYFYKENYFSYQVIAKP